MDTVKRGLNRLRAGFVLPMSLVTTVITLLLVGASATYCTSQFRTSQLYLSRTRCRLVAQSAIEMAKLVLMEKCGGELTGIADPANPNFSVADTSSIIDAVMTEVRKPEFAERIPGVGPDMSVTVDVKYQNSGACKGYNFIYATAEHKHGGRSTTVTLQEMIKIPISTGSIFDYAYFANHDGHLTSQYMVINGDVRANEDFYITGAEINGYVYASNTVHLATEKNKWGWWDDQDPCIRSFDSYNSMYRKGSKKEFSTYAKARPTNPLRRNGQEWIGGFEAVDATQEVGESMPSGLSFWEKWAWIWKHGGTGGSTTTTVAAPTLTAEIKPSDAVMEKKEDFIINAQAVHDDDTSYWGRRNENSGKEIARSPGVLRMPQIAWTDAGLKQYKDYAATATTVKGKTGGSLICSNCFVKAEGEGKTEQLSMSLKMDWTPVIDSATRTRYENEYKETHSWQDLLSPTDYNKDFYNEETITDDKITPDYDRSKAGQYAPKNSVLVYDCISAEDYQRKSTTEKANWRQLKDPLADSKDGVIGDFTSGYSGTIPVGTHAGTSLFFGAEDLKASLMSKGFAEADAQRLVDKFNDDRWTKVGYHRSSKTEKTYIDAGYEPVANKTYWVTLYQYATSVPQVYNSKRKKWEDESGWTSISWRDPYYAKSPRCFRSSDMSDMSSTLVDAYKGYFGTDWSAQWAAQTAVNTAISDAKSGWTEKSSYTTGNNGYYKSSSIQGYIAFDLVRYYEEGKDDIYRVEANIVSTKSSGVSAKKTPKESSKTVYVYDSVYYSSLPAGYIELSIVTNTYRETTIDVSYTPFPQLPKPDEKEVRKTLETKFVQLYEYNSSWWSPGRDWSAVSGSGFRSGYCNVATTAGSLKNRIVKQSDVSAVSAQFERDFPAVDADAVAEGMLDGDWSETTQGYYKSGSSYGYLAISLIGVYRGGDVSYEFEYAYASASDKTRIESQTSELDVMEVVYLPVHEYSTSRQSGWTKLTSDSTGFVNSSYGGAFNGLFMLTSERNAALEGFEGSFYGSGISSDAIKNYFTSQTGRNAGWGKPQYQSSSWSSGHYGYYNPQVAGYMAVKVVRGAPDYWGRVTYSLDYSSFVDSKEATQDGGTGNDTVAGNCIPVYEHLSVDEWNGLAYWQKGRWTRVTKTGYTTQEHIAAFESSHDDMYFTQESLNSVASYCASQDSSLASKAGEIRSKVLALFTDSNGPGAKDGWEGGCTSGYIGKHPVGYLQVDVTADTHDAYDILADYAYLSVNEGEVGEKKTWKPGEKKIGSDPDYYRTHPDELEEYLRESGRYDVLQDEFNVHMNDWINGTYGQPQTVATRELRRIFVKDGYKIDTTARLYEGTDDADLILTRNDSGSVADRLGSGSTTADLLPFREDGAHCNYKSKNEASAPDKGAVILIGTWDFPICIDGPVVFESDVVIRGFVSGRGTIYSGRNIHVIGDINYKNPPYWPDTGSEPETKGKDLLVLISRGSIVFGNYVKYNNTTSMDESWSGTTDSLLSGNYINGQANTDDARSKWGKNNTAVPYVAMNYTQNDTKGWTKYKVVYTKTSTKQEFSRTVAKYYESVVGDYVFISKNNSGDTAPDEDSSRSTYGCSSRLAQTWDLGFGTTAPSSWQKQENFLRYGCYQSKVLDAYAKHKGWGEAERVGLTTRKTMSDLWNLHRTDLQNFYITKQTDGYGGYGGDSKSQAAMADIQDVNAVLYSSMGIFGIVGGKYSPVTINGAVIGQDEALFPYTQYQAKRKHWWQWWLPRTRTETSNLALTINWDIRLNLKSTESRRNQEGEDQHLSQPITVDETSSGNANTPKILSWQEVPNSFNEEYHPTE